MTRMHLPPEMQPPSLPNLKPRCRHICILPERWTRGWGGGRGTCEVILGLPHVHPVARQCEGKEAFVQADEGEGLLLDAGGPQLDAIQHLGAQDVDPRVDLVAHKVLHRRKLPNFPAKKD